MRKLKTLVLPRTGRLEQVCSAECRRLLDTCFDPVYNETDRDYSEGELLEMISDAEVILTSWGSPKLTEEMLEKASRLYAVGHAAGSVKDRIPRGIFGKGVKVFSGAPRIAQSVGEYCLAVLLASLRHIHRMKTSVLQGQWEHSRFKGHELTGNTVGIVAASSTARAFIRYLAPFQVNLLIYDPYLSEEQAARLGARKAALGEVMSCPIISLHAPPTPSTNKMINKDLLRLIPDGAVFINSARPSLIDEDALFDELRTGRFVAAIDVFGSEPHPPSPSLLAMENLLPTPHIAAATYENHLALMHEVVQDIQRSVRGETTRFEISEKMWETMA